MKVYSDPVFYRAIHAARACYRSGIHGNDGLAQCASTSAAHIAGRSHDDRGRHASQWGHAQAQRQRQRKWALYCTRAKAPETGLGSLHQLAPVISARL